MRFAVGVDIVEIARLSRLLQDHPSGAADLFTELELAYCADKRNRDASLAARFAAKEAFLKAFGTGLRPPYRWTDIEVRNDQLGRPWIALAGHLATDVAARGGVADVSLSHTGAYAIAQVSLVSADRQPDQPGGATP